MKKSFVAAAVVIGFLLAAFSGWASVYVSDNLEAPLRTGPGTEYKIVGLLRSGQIVDVLSEKDGWSNVRLADENGSKEGWILTRYLMRREPWATRVKKLETENVRLRDTVSPMEKDLNEAKLRTTDLSAALKKKTDEFEALKIRHETLKRDAAGFLELQETFERTRFEFDKMKAEFAKTAEENRLLHSSQRHKWFLAGALVLLFGLILGLIMGRREKKRSSRLYL